MPADRAAGPRVAAPGRRDAANDAHRAASRSTPTGRAHGWSGRMIPRLHPTEPGRVGRTRPDGGSGRTARRRPVRAFRPRTLRTVSASERSSPTRRGRGPVGPAEWVAGTSDGISCSDILTRTVGCFHAFSPQPDALRQDSELVSRCRPAHRTVVLYTRAAIYSLQLLPR